MNTSLTANSLLPERPLPDNVLPHSARSAAVCASSHQFQFYSLHSFAEHTRMWCAACRADVAAELSTDNRRMMCARCHSELGTAVGSIERAGAGPRLQDTERNARELLARWSTQHLLEA